MAQFAQRRRHLLTWSWPRCPPCARSRSRWAAARALLCQSPRGRKLLSLSVPLSACRDLSERSMNLSIHLSIRCICMYIYGPVHDVGNACHEPSLPVHVWTVAMRLALEQLNGRACAALTQLTTGAMANSISCTYGLKAAAPATPARSSAAFFSPIMAAVRLCPVPATNGVK